MSQQENPLRIPLLLRVLVGVGFYIMPVYGDGEVGNLVCYRWHLGMDCPGADTDVQENDPCSTEEEAWLQAIEYFDFDKKYPSLVKLIGCADAVLEALEYELRLGNAYPPTDKAFLELDKWCSTYPVEEWRIDRMLNSREWSWHLTESARDMLEYFAYDTYLSKRYNLK